MKIRVVGHNGEGKFPFGESGPWKEFEKTIVENGNEICGVNFEESADAIICHSVNSQVFEFIERFKIPLERRILILWEPFSVERTRYLDEVISRFGLVFAPSREWAQKVNGIEFRWPQDEFNNRDVFTNWDERKHKCVMIQGNKFSACKGELYSLRRRVLKELSKNELDLFGTDWNRGFKFDWWHWSRSFLHYRLGEHSFTSAYGIGRQYDKYQGVTPDKNKTLESHRISIVIENSLDFISEKLFDSIRAGCVTVYVGPALENYNIPEHAAICMKPDYIDITKKIRELISMSSSELELIAHRQNQAMRAIVDEWRNTNVLRNLARDMTTYLKKYELSDSEN